ncbi:hypothetical protein I7I48_08293 [Histoplasma ohiense]|nr:hypothetical protein I7I48_08293 [Histoplasma ohiense (nom. inval.)]
MAQQRLHDAPSNVDKPYFAMNIHHRCDKINAAAAFLDLFEVLTTKPPLKKYIFFGCCFIIFEVLMSGGWWSTYRFP